jgi:hypothetical protein
MHGLTAQGRGKRRPPRHRLGAKGGQERGVAAARAERGPLYSRRRCRGGGPGLGWGPGQKHRKGGSRQKQWMGCPYCKETSRQTPATVQWRFGVLRHSGPRVTSTSSSRGPPCGGGGLGGLGLGEGGRAGAPVRSGAAAAAARGACPTAPPPRPVAGAAQQRGPAAPPPSRTQRSRARPGCPPSPSHPRIPFPHAPSQHASSPLPLP